MTSPTTSQPDAKLRAQSFDTNLDLSNTTSASSADQNNRNLLLGDNVGHEYGKLYKRRFFGLAQLTLLNIVVSWDWLTFAPVSNTSARYFNVSQSAINWLSTSFLFAFVVATPGVIWSLNRSGPKLTMVVASALIFVGNWIRYAGTRSGDNGIYGVVMFGQILIGLAQPFTLSAPTRYSDLWFSEKGRITATAVASLANPLGGALGQLIDPFWANKPSDVPNMVLYVAIISSIAAIPSIFIPSRPPTPPTATSIHSKSPPLTVSSMITLLRTPSFHLLFWPFTIYVSAFNATSTLLNQILHPYSFTEDEAGLTGAILIIAGLVAAAISSPFLDRFTQLRLPTVRILVPIIAAMYLALIFVPQTRTVAAPFAVAGILGAASFALVPLALEMLVEFTYGIVGPEVGSAVAWAGGQVGGAVWILVMQNLKGGVGGEPKKTMIRALVWQSVWCWIVVPLPLVLGFWGTGRRVREEREREREAA